jgi:hypothetical protein
MPVHENCRSTCKIYKTCKICKICTYTFLFPNEKSRAFAQSEKLEHSHAQVPLQLFSYTSDSLLSSAIPGWLGNTSLYTSGPEFLIPASILHIFHFQQSISFSISRNAFSACHFLYAHKIEFVMCSMSVLH